MAFDRQDWGEIPHDNTKLNKLCEEITHQPAEGVCGAGGECILDKLTELYEQFGNLYHLRRDKPRSEIFYGVMVLLKQQKFSPGEIDDELQKTMAEIEEIRERTGMM
jgi:hypothetical protein